ncbi:MAG: helix-turn-helix transcriptional regulator [Bacteroidales bacterium]|nr:helix-turn-helix transcriptional regulator [Bacteroidales bacterium]
MGIAERKEREREQRRQSIIDAAEKVFFTKGYDSSTMDDIASTAELSKGTLYLYFQSKDELHFEIMDRGNQILLVFMEKAINLQKNGRENLRLLGEAFVEFSNSHPDYFQAMMFFQSRDVEHQRINEQKLKKFIMGRSSISMLNNMVSKGIADGSVRNDFHPSHLTTLLWSQMMGILVMYAMKKPAFEYQKISREELIAIHLDLIRDGLKPENMEVKNHA